MSELRRLLTLDSVVIVHKTAILHRQPQPLARREDQRSKTDQAESATVAELRGRNHSPTARKSPLRAVVWQLIRRFSHRANSVFSVTTPASNSATPKWSGEVGVR